METESATRESSTDQLIQNVPTINSEIQAVAPGEVRVIRRNGKVTAFDADKISVAITKTFLAIEGGNAAASSRIHETVADLTDQIVKALTRRLPSGGTVHIEDIQDQVELALMRSEHHKVARAYVLYRDKHARQRAEEDQQQNDGTDQQPTAVTVTLEDGSSKPLDFNRLNNIINEACADLIDVEQDLILIETLRNLFDGVPEKDVAVTLVMSARTLIEKEPNYSYVAARLLMDSMRSEALSFINNIKSEATQHEMQEGYVE